MRQPRPQPRAARAYLPALLELEEQQLDGFPLEQVGQRDRRVLPVLEERGPREVRNAHRVLSDGETVSSVS